MKKYIKDAVFDEIYELAKVDLNIVLIAADTDAFGLKRFKAEFPDRFLDVGVAEQAMVTIAAGMALNGKKVFIYAIAPFVTLRCLEQIKVNLCVMDLPVFILGLGIGSAYGFDGPTHNSLYDVGIMTCMPNLDVYSPADYISARYCVKKSVIESKPSYIRVDKDSFDEIYDEERDFSKGFSLIKKGDSDVLILSTGICSHYARSVDRNVSIIDLFCLTKLDRKELSRVIRQYNTLVLYEEQWKRGGMLGIVADIIFDFDIHIKVKRIGVQEQQCIEHQFGTREWLHNQYGISVENLRNVSGVI